MRVHEIIVFLALILFFQVAQASPEDWDDCQGPEIFTLKVPADYHAPNSKTFDYSFRFHQGAESSPVIIVLPGGPGGPGIAGSSGKERLGAIPESYSVISTDPRGIGCNDFAELNQDNYFSTEFLARDALEIVKFLEKRRGVPLHYILFGQSYGTVQATEAAVLAQQLHVTLPQELVLEGIVGHAFQSYAQWFESYQNEWSQIRAGIPSQFRSLKGNGQLPVAPGAVWAQIIENDLNLGYRPDGTNYFLWHLSGSGSMQLLQALEGLDARTNHGMSMPETRINRVIACRELYADVENLRDLKNGNLSLAGENICGSMHTLAAAYDSAAWPVPVPIIYFQGAHDPATPLAQARYHFEKQTQTQRYWIQADLAGHGSLTVTLNAPGCSDALWQAMTSHLSTLGSAVEKCDGLVYSKLHFESLAPQIQVGAMDQ